MREMRESGVEDREGGIVDGEGGGKLVRDPALPL